MEKLTTQKNTKRPPLYRYLFSFRARVYTVVTIIVLFIGFISFQMFSKYLSGQLQQCNNENILALTSILSEQYLLNVTKDSSKVIYPMLDKLLESSLVERAYLTDSRGHSIYPASKADSLGDPNHRHLLSIPMADTIGIFKLDQNNEKFIRSYIKLYNQNTCTGCHAGDPDILGYLFLDFSIKKIEKNVKRTKNFGFMFTITLVVGLFLTVGSLHFRHIRGALAKFKHTFATIEEGNMAARVAISANDELGNLASHFNRTLDELELSRKQIDEYHQRELLNAQKLATVGEMAASFAHEIKNPLTGIVNSLEMMAATSDGGIDPVIIDEIRKQSTRVTRAINELLQFSKPIRIECRKEDLNQLVDQIAQSLKVVSANDSVRINVQLDTSLHNCYFDPVQLEKAISNIGINAVQAVSDNGEIVLQTRLSEDQRTVSITIADDGPGVKDEDMLKILKPFYTTKPQGTGLGLAITREIISKHDGDITIENRRAGGVQFTISIPYITQKAGTIC